MKNDLLPTTQTDVAFLSTEIDHDPRLKSPHTKKAYISDLQAFDLWRAGRRPTRLLVEEYASDLQRAGKSPETINRHLASIRWYARRLAKIAEDSVVLTPEEKENRASFIELAENMSRVEDVTGTRLQKGRHITPGELSALVSACKSDPAISSIRDLAMITLAWTTGLRREEITTLTLDDIEITDPGREATLRVHGKRDKIRIAYLYDNALQHLLNWSAIRGLDPGFIFCPIRKNDKLSPRQKLSGEAMRLILRKRVILSGIPDLTWHDFRRSFAGNLLDNGQDLVTVQKLMGHSSPITTSNYDRRGDEVLRKAVRTLFVPF